LNTAAGSLPRSDLSHDWLAYEYCAVTLLRELTSNDPESFASLVESDPDVAFDRIDDILAWAWRSPYVSCWFAGQSFNKKKRSVCGYIKERLQQATLPPPAAQIAPAIVEALSRHLNLAAIVFAAVRSYLSNRPPQPTIWKEESIEDEWNEVVEVPVSAKAHSDFPKFNFPPEMSLAERIKIFKQVMESQPDTDSVDADSTEYKETL
jgi:hypothetical protein